MKSIPGPVNGNGIVWVSGWRRPALVLCLVLTPPASPPHPPPSRLRKFDPEDDDESLSNLETPSDAQADAQLLHGNGLSTADLIEYMESGMRPVGNAEDAFPLNTLITP